MRWDETLLANGQSQECLRVESLVHRHGDLESGQVSTHNISNILNLDANLSIIYMHMSITIIQANYITN